MSVLRDHLVLMFIYALASGIFFSLLWKESRAERIRFFLKIFLILFAGAICFGWAMFPFPRH